MTRDGAAASALVTGASGFIGRRLVRTLASAGWGASCLVRPTSVVDALRAAGAHLVTGDVTDRESIERALTETQPDVVFHLAGLVRASRTSMFMRANAAGVEAVAAACAACAKPPTLVVVSSLAAAGPCANDHGRPRNESDPPAPVSGYGRSKLAGERAAARFANDLPITIVRPPIVYGPEDRGVLEMMRPIARWGVHPVAGRGTFRLSTIHVDDLVDAMILAAEKGERMSSEALPGRGVCFVAGDQRPTYVELGEMMASALGRSSVRIVRVPHVILRAAGRCGDLISRMNTRKSWINSDKITEALAGSWMCSSEKAREQLEWRPKISLEEGLRETAQWYREARWL